MNAVTHPAFYERKVLLRTGGRTESTLPIRKAARSLPCIYIRAAGSYMNEHLRTRKRNFPTIAQGDGMATRDIYITVHDMERLQKLIEVMSDRDRKSKPYIDRLEEELDRAHILEADQIPPDVITMNSKVRLQDLNSREETVYTLVFPGKANAGENAISVLAPVGTALLGYREGDVIEWQVPAGTKRLKVLEVMYQPERSGDFRS